MPIAPSIRIVPGTFSRESPCLTSTRDSNLLPSIFRISTIRQDPTPFLSTLLHIAAIFPTHLIKSMADLAEAVGLYCFHQRGEDVLAVPGGLLEVGEAWG